MRGFNLIPADTQIKFVDKRYYFFVFSALIIAASIALVVVRGLNFGIDFKGGILIEVGTPGPADIGDIRGKVGGLGLGDAVIQNFGADDVVLIQLPRQDAFVTPEEAAKMSKTDIAKAEEQAQQEAVSAVRGVLGEGMDYRRIETVGPKVSAELLQDGLMAVGLAMLAILIYIWFRFEWQFGVGAIIALFHDVVATIGVFALMQFEFNLSTVAAVLTIAGYSINDTVVIFDRVREKLRKYKKMPLPELLDFAINKTLSRTVMTSLTTLLALAALYGLGGAVIRDFSFAMIFGILVGTYSTVYVAVPVLLYLNITRRDISGEVIEEGKPEQTGA